MPAINSQKQWLSDIYDTYADDVRNVVRFRLRPAGLDSMADDVLQDVFITAFEKYNGLATHPDIRRWLFTTANFKCKNLVRRHATEGRRILWDADVDYQNAIPDPTAEQAFDEVLDDQVDFEALIRRVKAEMPEGDVFLYTQVYEENIHPTRLSAAYGISEAAMRMRISRMRQRILRVIKNITSIVLLCFFTDIFK